MEKPEALNAPLFRLLVDRLEAGGRHVVLDLGAASTPMLDLLGRFRCRVQIVDLASEGGIERLNAAEPGDALNATAESLLPTHRSDGEAFDIVLCWDLPNYLTPPSLSALMSGIVARASPAVLAHALIAYSERLMPDRPSHYLPTEDSRLVDRGGAVAKIEAPRYSPEDLGRIMGGFTIERARLLSNGMQEMLFRRQA